MNQFGRVDPNALSQPSRAGPRAGVGALHLGAAVGLAGLLWLLVASGGDPPAAPRPSRASALAPRENPAPATAPISHAADPPAVAVSGTPRDVGYAVIATLQQSSAYDRAADYALTEAVEIRRDLLIAAFNPWGQAAPSDALAAARRIADPVSRQIALQSVFSGWAQRDPRQLAEAALQFPATLDADSALTKALRAWMHADPWTAGDWILSHQRAVAVAEAMFYHDRR